MPEDDPVARRPAAPAPRTPSDLLDVRRTFMRRVGSPPTMAQLRAHAERFGVDEVAETAAELGYSEERLTSLIVSLDLIDASRRQRGVRPFGPAGKRRAADRRARDLLGLGAPTPPLTET